MTFAEALALKERLQAERSAELLSLLASLSERELAEFERMMKGVSSSTKPKAQFRRYDGFDKR